MIKLQTLALLSSSSVHTCQRVNKKATCTETQGIVGYHELLVVYTYRCSGRLHRARYRMKESGSVQPPFSIIHVGV